MKIKVDKSLSDRQKLILKLDGEGYTHQHIGNIVGGISRQRVNRIIQDIKINQKYKTKRAIITKIVREIYDFGSKTSKKDDKKRVK